LAKETTLTARRTILDRLLAPALLAAALVGAAGERSRAEWLSVLLPPPPGSTAEGAPAPSSRAAPRVEEIPPPAPGGFPALPPDPYAADTPGLPPLEDELWMHGGAHLYEPEGDRRNWEMTAGQHYDVLRLPQDWQAPQPFTLFSEFQGADPIHIRPHLKWPGQGAYYWDVGFTAYGSYRLFGFALEENGRRQDVVGHQLLLDLDLQLTGTERFHVQYRPIGERNTGGSYYQFSDPEGYVDNSTGEPDRYWFEGEIHSMLGAFVDPFAVLDYRVLAGKFPLSLQNGLLMNDDVIGLMLSKNTIYLGTLSLLNVQAFYAFNDVDSFPGDSANLYGMHITADYRKTFYEITYAFLENEADATRNQHFAAISRTAFYGPLTVSGRALFKWGDEGGRGDGQLFVLEASHGRVFDDNWTGVEHAVFYGNAFLATEGWNSISGGNFNRLRTPFEVDPLVRIAAGRDPGDNWGLALGVQLFRRHDDESIIPEVAFEAPEGNSVFGLGLRYLRKTGPRSFFELLGVAAFSDDPRFDREGVFISQTILF
jgi:hypothetical protein